MSYINAKNITSENITVTNLNVAYINGQPYTANPCGNSCTTGYYVACPDCDYQGPDICDCGTSCDYVAPEPDPCDCYVPCNSGGGGGAGATGPTGPTGGYTGPTGPTGQDSMVTGPTGIQGIQGIPGESTGLILYLNETLPSGVTGDAQRLDLLIDISGNWVDTTFGTGATGNYIYAEFANTHSLV